MYRIVIAALLLLSSCAGKLIPLKGEYPTQPMKIETTKSFNEVWSNVIDLLAEKGLPIKIIDKSSGLIISNAALLSTTIETKDGSPKDTGAYIVLPKTYYKSEHKSYAVNSFLGKTMPVKGEWNIHIKEGNGKTLINVNIVNVSYEYSYNSQTHIQGITTYKSTGVFEKTISDIIK